VKVYSWTGEHPNFGDDLNHFLWQFVMPEVVADPEDGGLLIGVGTVLSNKLPIGKPRVVMGSGVGYSAVPQDLSGPGWAIYAVRGPLTAKLLNLPVGRAVVDPAVLLPTMPNWSGHKHGDAILVPHWITAQDSDWSWASEKCGLKYVDPRQDPKVVINAIAGARLVVAESMHAAIIADAFRVPWIPIIGLHRAIFKWTDWTSSLSMDYQPHKIGLWAHIQHKLSPNPQFTGGGGSVAVPSDVATKLNLAASARGVIGKVPSIIRRQLIIRDLSRVQNQPSQLSSDLTLRGRQKLLLERIAQLRSDFAAGRIGRAISGEAV
tara:strand:+ start:3962 stop:4921 length:960 start_codon:yes stop_codon:yes gene_type:complete